MIFVFKTSVQCKADVQQLRPHLDEIKPSARWSFDLEDCDKILRVDMPMNDAKRIIDVLQMNGFVCEQLMY